MNWYTFRGDNSAIFTFASFPMRVSSLKKEFAPRGANSFLKEWTPSERQIHPGKQIESNSSCLPLKNGVGVQT